jgi:DNA-binding MarR family transcriptional regulator
MIHKLENLGLLIKRIQDRNHRAMDSGLAPLGVTLVQWNALREIDRHPGSSQHRLAELTFNSDQAFGALATRLLQRGFVERHAGEGRAVVHRLTAEGQALYHRGREVLAEVVTTSFAPLTTQECDTLTALLDKLL